MYGMGYSVLLDVGQCGEDTQSIQASVDMSTCDNSDATYSTWMLTSRYGWWDSCSTLLTWR